MVRPWTLNRGIHDSILTWIAMKSATDIKYFKTVLTHFQFVIYMWVRFPRTKVGTMSLRSTILQTRSRIDLYRVLIDVESLIQILSSLFLIMPQYLTGSHHVSSFWSEQMGVRLDAGHTWVVWFKSLQKIMHLEYFSYVSFAFYDYCIYFH